jgi:23S rRNA pseudouridine955/2504/2580 synthase
LHQSLEKWKIDAGAANIATNISCDKHLERIESYFMPAESYNTNQVNLITVDEDHDGQRIDNFLLTLLKGAPRSLVYKLLRKGEVRINKKRAKPVQRLVIGDIVRVAPVKIKETSNDEVIVPKTQAEIIGKSILFEDEYYIAVNKPSGMAVHGGSGIKLGLIELMRAMRPQQKFLELVHRLDRDTSGVILIAKKRSALVAVQKLFQGQKSIDKRYLAIVHGEWPDFQDKVDMPLKKNEVQGGERIVRVEDDGKPSLTKFKVLDRSSRYSLIEAKPITGRTHQIRVHCQFAGCGIAGDPKYLNKVEEAVDKQIGIKRLCLHAYRLAFVHPMTEELLEITSPLEGKFLMYKEKEGLRFEF